MNVFRPLIVGLGLAAALALAAPSADAQILGGNAGPNFKNLLDNGWFNIYQRGTTAVTTITTTATYHADRWAGYSGTSTNLTLTNVTASLPTGGPTFTNAEQVQRASGQTGVVKTCLVQEIPTADVTPLAGQTVAVSFWALAGSNFSANSNNITINIATGTGTDQGLASLISGWTGAGNWSNANYVQPITANWARYATNGVIPATATEAAVQICFTPVGTALTNDYFQITGVQLEQGTVATNMEERPLGVELTKVQRYAYAFQESASVINFRGNCVGVTTSIDACTIPFPVTLRAAPTMTYTAGFAATTTNAQSAITACTAMTTYAGLTGAAASTSGVVVDCASSAGTPAAGVPGTLWDLGTGSATGKFLASADF